MTQYFRGTHFPEEKRKKDNKFSIGLHVVCLSYKEHNKADPVSSTNMW